MKNSKNANIIYKVLTAVFILFGVRNLVGGIIDLSSIFQIAINNQWIEYENFFSSLYLNGTSNSTVFVVFHLMSILLSIGSIVLGILLILSFRITKFKSIIIASSLMIFMVVLSYTYSKTQPYANIISFPWGWVICYILSIIYSIYKWNYLKVNK